MFFPRRACGKEQQHERRSPCNLGCVEGILFWVMTQIWISSSEEFAMYIYICMCSGVIQLYRGLL